jgi:hypothetical protein
MNRIVGSAIVAVVIGLSCCTEASAQTQKLAAKKTYQQTEAEKQANNGAAQSFPLIDHGGVILPSSTTHAIYWGTQADFPGDLQSGMDSLLTGFERSSYLGIADQYMRGAGLATVYGGKLVDSSSEPPAKAPTTAEIGAEVCKLFPSPDPGAVYFVFTSNAPNINFCAWHASASCNGVTFQIAYVPNQKLLLSGCSPYLVNNLHCNNHTEGTVASADSVAHEFMEAITDPHLHAWYDRRGAEIGDKCNFEYQTCVNLTSGPNWQIQEEWSNTISGCQQ